VDSRIWQLYQYRRTITACGLGEAIEFQDAFPEIDYVRVAANGQLPFVDSTIEIAASTDERQRRCEHVAAQAGDT
jgi:hypothetical protein